MKTNIIFSILFALGGASTAAAWARYEECSEAGINTEKQCYAQCRTFPNRRWSADVKFDYKGLVTQCTCNLTSKRGSDSGLPSENIWQCTRSKPEPEPKKTEENCNKQGIKTWNDCQAHCKSLSGNWHASVKGRTYENITECTCKYGSHRQNTYTCTRKPTTGSYLRSD